MKAIVLTFLLTTVISQEAPRFGLQPLDTCFATQGFKFCTPWDDLSTVPDRVNGYCCREDAEELPENCYQETLCTQVNTGTAFTPIEQAIYYSYQVGMRT